MGLFRKKRKNADLDSNRKPEQEREKPHFVIPEEDLEEAEAEAKREAELAKRFLFGDWAEFYGDNAELERLRNAQNTSYESPGQEESADREADSPRLMGQIVQLSVFSDRVEVTMDDRNVYYVQDPGANPHLHNMLLHAKNNGETIEGSYNPQTRSIICLDVI